MGQLVFQATLGGQVNLVGPNTASTYNLNVPAVSSTLATLTGTETFTNKTLTTPVINGFTGDTSIVNIGSGQFYKDTSGNVGIGTSSPAFALDLGSAAANIRVAPSTTTNNALTRYVNTGGIGYVGLDNSTGGLTTAYALNLYHSGAYPITFSTSGTERMRIDSSGNVGIGTSSPGAKLHVSGSSASNSTIDVIAVNTQSSTTAALTSTGSTYSFAGVGANTAWFSSSGTVALGNYSAYPIQFVTNGAERARIDSSGNLLVGTTSTSYASTFQGSTSNRFVLSSVNTAASTPRGYLSQFPSGGNDTSSYHFIGNTTTDRIVIYGNGNIQNTNNSYGSLSDIKIKENITDATPKLADLMQVRIVNFNLKSDSGHKQIGVIAQELEQVFPSLIEETPDRNDEEGVEQTTTKSVKYSVFVPMLIKAMQEQQAIITQLQADVAALKGQ